MECKNCKHKIFASTSKKYVGHKKFTNKGTIVSEKCQYTNCNCTQPTTNKKNGQKRRKTRKCVT